MIDLIYFTADCMVVFVDFMLEFFLFDIWEF